MRIKGIIFEDFINYKLPCMVIEFPYCDFKCDRECNKQVCQNASLANSPIYDMKIDHIIDVYLKNDITKAIVCQGLEPFDSCEELFIFINYARKYTKDPIIIYTGYTEKELAQQIMDIQKLFTNIIIKFGRFIPDSTSIYDNLLGVWLPSDNQYAKQIC